MQVDLLSVEDVPLRLSFKPDPAARPRNAGGLLSLGLELAALDNLAMELPGEARGAHMHALIAA